MQDIVRQLEQKRAAAELGGGQRRIDSQHKKGQAHGAGTHRIVARSGHVRGMGHVCRASLPRFRYGPAEYPRRWRRDRLRHRQRSGRLCLQPGLYGLWRIAFRGACRKDLQDHGPCHQSGSAGHRHQRFGRRTDSRRSRLAGRICGCLSAQCPGIGRGAADFSDHGPLCGRRRLLSRHDRLYLHGQGQFVHVCHRSRGRKDRHARRSDARGTGRRHHAFHGFGSRRSRL